MAYRKPNQIDLLTGAPSKERKSFDDGQIPSEAPPSYDSSIDPSAVRRFEIRFLSGPALKMEMEESFTVRLMKLRVEDARSIPIWNQTLVYQGNVLNDDKTIKESGIKDDQFLYCLNVAPESERAEVGVPDRHAQVDCPTCGILIAVPPDMDEFECPRCETVCRAPPKYQDVAPLPPPPKPKEKEKEKEKPKVGGVGAGSDRAKREERDRERERKRQERQKAAAEAKKELEAKLKKSEQDIYLELQQQQMVVEREENNRRLKMINFPAGNLSVWLRAFWIVQCPLLNLWWYFEQQRMLPKQQRYPWEVDWYDTDMAKQGNIWGWVIFLIWAPFYVWMCVALLNYNLMAAILSVMFGPLLLLVFFWDINSTCQGCCGGRGGSGSYGDSCCYCYCGNCDCNCDGCCDGIGNCCSGVCDCCGSCCKDFGNCCEGCLKCCTSCQCGGCDCGGCDC
jgi:hypothetical protein